MTDQQGRTPSPARVNVVQADQLVMKPSTLLLLTYYQPKKKNGPTDVSDAASIVEKSFWTTPFNFYPILIIVIK